MEPPRGNFAAIPSPDLCTKALATVQAHQNNPVSGATVYPLRLTFA